VSTAEIPLFPLNTVLFPGGVLPLRIFETRYVDMVRRCSRAESGFGVVLLREGQEAGTVPVRICTIGTYARIVDFTQVEGGLLGVIALGERRFQVEDVSTQKNGLHVAKVSWLAEEQHAAVPEQFLPLVDMLKKALPQLGELHRHLHLNYDDAAWVAGRVIEILPLELKDKQICQEMEDALERLQQLKPLLKAASKDSVLQS